MLFRMRSGCGWKGWAAYDVLAVRGGSYLTLPANARIRSRHRATDSAMRRAYGMTCGGADATQEDPPCLSPKS